MKLECLLLRKTDNENDNVCWVQAGFRQVPGLCLVGSVRVLVVEFGTDRARLCRCSGLVVSFLNSTTRTGPDTTRHVCACDQVSDKVWSVSNSTVYRPTNFVYDQTRPTDKVRTRRDLADKFTTGQSPRTCRNPKRSVSLVWLGSSSEI